MSLPELLDSALDGEPSVAQVQLGGEDVLVVTPNRTVVYRADGLLSDESIETYPHNAERLSLSVGRRKAKLTLDYGLDGSDTLAFPAKRVEQVVHPILAGVISAAGITEPGETVHKTFRFSDLTLIVTSQRVVKHIGSAVWDSDYEELAYSELTDVDFEEGSVATSVVLTHNGRHDRFKTPNSDARAVREAIVEAVCEYHDVTSIEELRQAMAQQDEASPAAEVDRLDFGDGPDPLSAEPAELEATPQNSTQPAADTESSADEQLAGLVEETDSQSPDTVQSAEQTQSADASHSATTAQSTEHTSAAEQAQSTPTTQSTADPHASDTQAVGEPTSTPEPTVADTEPTTEPFDAFEGSAFESAGPVDEDDVAEQLAVLTATVEKQEQQLDRQSELIETLIEELRRGR
jgi:hypothetical protein